MKRMTGGRLRWALRLVVLDLGSVMVITAGVSLIIGRIGGLYWLLPVMLIYLRSVNNGWH